MAPGPDPGYGDYITTDGSEICPAGRWLLVPLDFTLVRLLEQFDAEREDLAEHDGREPEVEELDTADDEPNGDDEPNTGDDEPDDYEGGQNGGLPLARDPRTLGMIPVYASADEKPRPAPARKA